MEVLYVPYITNQVLGTQLYTVLLKYRDCQKALQDYELLNHIYKLGNAIILIVDSQCYLAGTKPHTRTRLQKILNASKAQNKNDFIKHDKHIMPLSNPHGKNTPTIIHTLQSDHIYTASKQHHKLYNTLGAKFPEQNTTKKSNAIIAVAKIKNW